jgi:hypothetical protein
MVPFNAFVATMANHAASVIARVRSQIAFPIAARGATDSRVPSARRLRVRP